MNKWVDKHSVNCYFCNTLFDERDGENADKYNNNDGGSICPKCLEKKTTCPICLGTGQDNPPPGKYHGLCAACKGTGKKNQQWEKGYASKKEAMAHYAPLPTSISSLIYIKEI